MYLRTHTLSHLFLLHILFSLLTPFTLAQSSGSFSLLTLSPNPSLNQRPLSENSSTDFGSTLIILGPNNITTNPFFNLNRTASVSGTIVGFILNQPFVSNDSYLLVNQPMRNGGSEYDGWVVGSVDEATGLAVPSIVPAGSSTGWSLVNDGRIGGTKLAYTSEADGDAEFLGELNVRMHTRPNPPRPTETATPLRIWPQWTQE
ncbi:MAG: hypothetical protein Q9227_004334 [Pyrenula ochraceoflavens]